MELDLFNDNNVLVDLVRLSHIALSSSSPYSQSEPPSHTQVRGMQIRVLEPVRAIELL